MFHNLAPFVSLKNVNTYRRVLIFIKVKVNFTKFTLLKNNILPKVHMASCKEAGCLDSRKTPQIIFFKRKLKVCLRRNFDNKRKQYDEKIFRN